MPINSRQKGKSGELEACTKLRTLFGWVCRRAQQYSGWAKGGGSPDIIVDETPTLFWEVKREENLSITRALLTAVNQAGRKCPVILHRRNRSKVGWMLTIRLEDLPRLSHAYHVAADSSTEKGTELSKKELSDEERTLSHSSYRKRT